MSGFRSYLVLMFAAVFCLHQVPKADGYDDDKYSSRYYYNKADTLGTKYRHLPDSINKGKAIIGKIGKYLAEVETPIHFKKAMYKASEFDNGKTEPPPSSPPPPPPPKKAAVPAKKPPKVVTPARRNETEAEKAERVHRTFEKLLTFVEIVGQVDNYVSTKWRNLVKTVSNLYEEENDDEYRVHMKRLKGCPLLNVETN